jgi:hypothetical protein
MYTSTKKEINQNPDTELDDIASTFEHALEESASAFRGQADALITTARGLLLIEVTGLEGDWQMSDLTRIVKRLRKVFEDSQGAYGVFIAPTISVQMAHHLLLEALGYPEAGLAPARFIPITKTQLRALLSAGADLEAFLDDALQAVDELASGGRPGARQLMARIQSMVDAAI